MTMLKKGQYNQKIRPTEQINHVRMATFSLPAVFTCPGADACLKGGYCNRGRYTTPDKVKTYGENYTQSLKDSFVDDVTNELRTELWDVQYVRIHPIGDFYSMDYFKKWVSIAIKNPNVGFYAYTKSVNIVKAYLADNKLPDNMTISYSYGGKFDSLIDPDNDYITIVVDPKKPIPTGFVDCGDDDLMMVKGFKKIAIKFHGGMKWENSGFSQVILPE